MGAAERLADAACERAAIDVLAERHRRSANVVHAISRRRDTRELRARMMLLLLELECPRGVKPRKSWYVPGAVARLGADGIRRAWEGYFGEEGPSTRTIRSHLKRLEEACLIAIAPGDWLPVRRDPDHPEFRPRHPQTFHVIHTDDEAEYWAGAGDELARAHPETRHNPTEWRRIFRDWRKAAASGSRQLLLPFVAPAAAEETTEPQGPLPPRTSPQEREQTCSKLMRAARARTAFEIQAELRDQGLHLHGRNSWRMAADPERLRTSIALLALAVARGDRIRSKVRWLAWAFEHAEPAELKIARQAIREHRE